MARPQSQLVTIDFLGIRSGENGKENARSAMDCHRQVTKRQEIKSCLRKIKPHMLQQVLSDGYLSNLEHSPKELHCEVSEDLKTMDLFPQHAAGFQSDSKDSQKPFLDPQMSTFESLNLKPHAKPSSSELMLFYNGVAAVYSNVSSDKAKAIMTMAAGNGNTANISSSVDLSKVLQESVSELEGSANQRHSLGVSHWKLPLAKKRSLGRFLQKRMVR